MPYRATEMIQIDGVNAFSPGDLVPDGHVEKFGLHDSVAEEGTAEAVEAVEGFDPSAHNAADVLAYLEAAEDSERVRVLELETAGKNRKTIAEAYAVVDTTDTEQPAAEAAGQASPVGVENA